MIISFRGILSDDDVQKELKEARLGNQVLGNYFIDLGVIGPWSGRMAFDGTKRISERHQESSTELDVERA